MLNKTVLFLFSFKVHVLQDKWRDAFDFADINKDSVLDIADVELCINNYIRLHNLTAEEVCVYTHRQKLSNTTFFRRPYFGSCRTEYVGNGNQIFWIFCKLYYFYEHLELKMILSTKYLDNLRPFTKQVKNDKEKQWKKFEADVWKIFFGLTFNRMESYHPELLLVFYKFLKKIFLWRT